MVQQLGDLGSVSLVQVEGQNEGWQSMQNTYGAAWEIAQQPTPPLDLRVVDANGAEVRPLFHMQPASCIRERHQNCVMSQVHNWQVTAFGIINSSGQQGVIPTGVQFSFGGSQGTSTSNSSSSASGGSSSSSSSASSSSSGGSSSSSSSSSDQVSSSQFSFVICLHACIQTTLPQQLSPEALQTLSPDVLHNCGYTTDHCGRCPIIHGARRTVAKYSGTAFMIAGDGI